jgi:hypothetical protein
VCLSPVWQQHKRFWKKLDPNENFIDQISASVHSGALFFTSMSDGGAKQIDSFASSHYGCVVVKFVE